MQLPLELSSAEFQGLLDSHCGGESIECLPREYSGPLHFRNSILIEGRGATFWKLEGPVVVVESSGVTLRDVRIEVTADLPQIGSDRDCALIVQPGTDVRLENVEIRGAVRGLRTEEGAWHYPYSLQLGCLLPGVNYEFLLRLIVPVQCQISSQVSGIDVAPVVLASGKNEVRLKLSSLPKDSLLCGTLCLKTSLLKRRISIAGRVVPARGDPDRVTTRSGSLLWSPPEWDSAESTCHQKAQASNRPKEGIRTEAAGAVRSAIPEEPAAIPAAEGPSDEQEVQPECQEEQPPRHETAEHQHRPYRFLGKHYFQVEELAVALANNWDEAVKHFGRRLVTDWVSGQLADQQLTNVLMDIAEDSKLNAELKLAVGLVAMNQHLPLAVRGAVVNREWLAQGVAGALEFLHGSVSQWMVRLRKDDQLERLQRRWQEAQQAFHQYGQLGEDLQAVRLTFAQEQDVRKLATNAQRENYPSNNTPLDILLNKHDLSWTEALVLAVAAPKHFERRAAVAEKQFAKYNHDLADAGTAPQIHSLTVELENNLRKVFGIWPIPTVLLERLKTASERAMGVVGQIVAVQLRKDFETRLAEFEFHMETFITVPASLRYLEYLEWCRAHICETLAAAKRELQKLYGNEPLPEAALTRLGAATRRATDRVNDLMSQYAATKIEVNVELPKNLAHDYENVKRRLKEIKGRFSHIDCTTLETLISKFDGCLMEFENEAAAILSNLPTPLHAMCLKDRRVDIKLIAKQAADQLRALCGLEKLPDASLKCLNTVATKYLGRIDALLAEHSAAQCEVNKELPQRLAQDYDRIKMRLAEIKVRFSDIDCSQLEKSLAEWEAFYGELEEAVNSFEQAASAQLSECISICFYPLRKKPMFERLSTLDSDLTSRRATLEQPQYRATRYYEVAHGVLSKIEARLRAMRSQLEAAIKRDKKRAIVTWLVVGAAIAALICSILVAAHTNSPVIAILVCCVLAVIAIKTIAAKASTTAKARGKVKQAEKIINVK